MSYEERKKLSVEFLEKGEKEFNQGSPLNMYYIEKALVFDSLNAAAWRELSVPYLKRGLAHQWRPLFDKAVEIDPISWQGWRGYLKLFFYRDYESAILDFNATDILTPNFTDYPQDMSVDYLRGLAYLGLRKYDESERYLTKYIDEVVKEKGENWVDVYAFLHRGIVYEYLCEYKKARQDFSIHLKNYNLSSDGYFHLSKLDRLDGNLARAKINLDSARNLFQRGYFMKRPYVESFEQIYISDIDDLEKLIQQKRAP
jgi:tetratricopeptide (TPR) repeat protein